jgi:hypothetical protein
MGFAQKVRAFFGRSHPYRFDRFDAKRLNYRLKSHPAKFRRLFCPLEGKSQWLK